VVQTEKIKTQYKTFLIVSVIVSLICCLILVALTVAGISEEGQRESSAENIDYLEYSEKSREYSILLGLPFLLILLAGLLIEKLYFQGKHAYKPGTRVPASLYALIILFSQLLYLVILNPAEYKLKPIFKGASNALFSSGLFVLTLRVLEYLRFTRNEKRGAEASLLSP
jgi:putative effector of murein hydrolase LrgA (UPF0299 family)